MTVKPLKAAFFNNLIIFNAFQESRPDVGSSNIIIFGFDTNSYPIDVLFFSPPDNPFIKLPPNFVF